MTVKERGRLCHGEKLVEHRGETENYTKMGMVIRGKKCEKRVIVGPREKGGKLTWMKVGGAQEEKGSAKLFSKR